MNRGWLNQTVVKVKTWRAQYWLSRDYSSVLALDAVNLDQVIDDSSGHFKHDQTTTVSKLTLPNVELVLKRYNARSQGHKFKRALRRSRARRCWLMSYEFAKAGLNVAVPVLMYERRIGLIRKTAYFANEFLSGDELLKALPAMGKEQQRQVADSVQQAFILMQKYKISHGDLKASNLLWVEGELFFIDLDAATKHLTFLGWKRSNKRDKKRFLKNWQQYPDVLALFSWM